MTTRSFTASASTASEDMLQRIAELEAQLHERSAALALAQAEIAALREQLAEERAERRVAEANLYQQHHLIDQFFEHAPICIHLYDRNGVSLRMNEANRSMIDGFDPSEILGKINILRDPSFVASGISALFERAYSGETVQVVGGSFFAPNAEGNGQRTMWYNRCIFPIKDAAGNVAGVVSLAQDITAQREAADELRRANSLLEGLFAHVPIGIQIYGRDGTSLRMNEANRHLLGFPSIEYGVGSYNILSDPFANQAGSSALFLRALAGETVKVPEIMADLSDPIMQWETNQQQLVLHYILFPIRNAEQEVVAVASCLLDITARKQAEAEVERLQVERKLLDSQRLQSLGVLTGGIAHDFNNLLAGILGYAQLALLDIAPDTSSHESISALILVTRRAADLTQQLLAYAGKGRFVVQPLNLNQLIREMSDLIQVSNTYQAQLSYNLYPALPLISADNAQIRQIVLNLLVNAAESFSDEDGMIEVATECVWFDSAQLQTLMLGEELMPGAYVGLRVRDNGLGMDEATLARIFEPFFTTKFTGRGLGLAALLGIVRGHHGALRVASAPHQGTTFEIWLPALGEGVAELAPVASLPAVVPELRKGTLLVIDDEEMIRVTSGLLLERMGYQVVVAGDGPTALALLRAGIADLVAVLLDLTMPRMSGDAVARAIKASYPTLPIILMSGYSAQEIAQHYADLASGGFLQKPFGSEALAAVLGKAPT